MSLSRRLEAQLDYLDQFVATKNLSPGEVETLLRFRRALPIPIIVRNVIQKWIWEI